MPTSHHSPPSKTIQRPPATTPPPVERTKDGLLTMLDAVDVEGWDGPAATALLTYVRTDLVRPLTIDVGLRGAAASQAEATAWEAVWLVLCDPHLRSARSPWGVIWQTARRALLGEVLAARWGTSWRRAWEHDAAERAGAEHRPVSLEALTEAGCSFPPAAPLSSNHTTTRVSAALSTATHGLIDAGWSHEDARRIVGEIACMDEALGHDATVIGWRPLASRLSLPPWQARRLTALLRGTVERPGLLARLIGEGRRVLDDSEVQESLASTRTRTRPSPNRRHRTDGAEVRRPQ
jgi:hypothetical protein